MNKSKLSVTLTASAILASQAAFSAAEIAATGKDDLKAQLATQDQNAVGIGEDDAELFTMCYMAPFEVSVQQTEYVCPICGERTTRVSPGYIEKRNGEVVSPDIDECRRLFARIPASAGMKLDESEYCRKCSPRVKRPEPALLVPNGRGHTRRVRHVTTDELSKLGDYFAATPDEQARMRKESRRLRRLLGL